ncbi:MAG: IPT/TIG domain-containing protein [Nitrosomonadales bacterium]|nr:IPT/TIG domain-containing protein [Nitrosomonadales bacterium]
MKHAHLILAFISTLVISACGGGGSTAGGGGTTAGGGTAPTLTWVGFTGIAAVGYPIVGGTVQLKCAAGSLPSGTTDGAGAWIAGGQASTPCAMQVSGGTINGATNTTPYHSIAMASSTVNITPLTDLMVANVAGTATPDVWFAGLTGDTLTTITAPSIITARQNIITAFSGLPNASAFQDNTLVATPGNTGDDTLAALRAAMSTTGVSYADLLAAAATPSISSAAVTTLNAALPTAWAGTISGSKPTITYVSPYAGVDVGSSLNIYGTNFDVIPANNTVTFNGIPATVTAATSMMLTVTVPNVAGGPIVVSTTTGTSLPYKDFIVGFPEVIGMSQYSGSAGTAVTISGTHFSTVPTNNIVEFTGANGRVTATVTGATATSISTIVPSGATTGTIYVTTPLGTNNLATVFTVSTSGGSSVPTIISFSPTSGAAGTTVTITGTNFSTTPANNTVTFNGTAAMVTAATATSLTVSVPGGAASGAIYITTSGGNALSAGSFTVSTSGGSSVPTITSFSPTSGAAGTTVTITGTNFSTTPANNSVTFSGTAATVTAATATSLTVTVPSGATTGAVSVTTAGGTATSAGSFTVSTGTLNSSGGTLTFSNPVKLVYGGGLPDIDVTSLSFPSPVSDTGGYVINQGGGSGYAWLMPSIPPLVYGQNNGAILYFSTYARLGSTNLTGIFIDTTMGPYSDANGYANNGVRLTPFANGQGTTGSCFLSGTNILNEPTCASMGITFDSAAGTLTFSSSTPLYDSFTQVLKNTVSGTIHFPPY